MIWAVYGNIFPLFRLPAERSLPKMSHINVISHRGANIYAPQNTLPAFKKSLEIGVDGFETDIHITKDDKLVLCHNYTIDSTSDGKGSISQMTLDQLKNYDFGSYFSPKFAGTRIPTMEEFLALVKPADISVLNIELKSPKKNETAIVSETIRLVKEYGLFEKLIISSFDPKLLVEAKQIDQNCKTGFLYSLNRKTAWSMIRHYVEVAKRLQVDALHPQNIFVNEKYVYEAHEAGLLVNTWTVNLVSDIEKMIRCGVDGIITNYPDVTKGILEKHTY